MLDAQTFTDKNVIEISNEKLIPLKIDTDSEYGMELFQKYNGHALPLILFINKDNNEIDRFYGYLPPYEFIIKIENALNNTNSFSDYLGKYNGGNHSSELIKLLADKYSDKGEHDKAISLFNELLISSNQSKNDNEYAKYAIATLELKKYNTEALKQYLKENTESSFYKTAINDYTSYLNRNAWKMAELDSSLNDALDKINTGLSLIDDTNQSYPYLLDTKAEILWKLNKDKEAIKIIEEAIMLDPTSAYYKDQKEKFLDSNH